MTRSQIFIRETGQPNIFTIKIDNFLMDNSNKNLVTQIYLWDHLKWIFILVKCEKKKRREWFLSCKHFMSIHIYTILLFGVYLGWLTWDGAINPNSSSVYWKKWIYFKPGPVNNWIWIWFVILNSRTYKKISDL